MHHAIPQVWLTSFLILVSSSFQEWPRRYVWSKVDTSTSASDVVKSIDLSMAIAWGWQAWEEASPETIKECFKKTWLCPEELGEEDDPFEGEDEMPHLQELIHGIISSCDGQEHIFANEEIEICHGYINHADPN